MKTFKNTNAANRGDFTTVEFAQGPDLGQIREAGEWVEVDELELDVSGATRLHRSGETVYFGSL